LDEGGCDEEVVRADLGDAAMEVTLPLMLVICGGLTLGTNFRDFTILFSARCLEEGKAGKGEEGLWGHEVQENFCAVARASASDPLCTAYCKLASSKNDCN